jgi:hypothetical protein
MERRVVSNDDEAAVIESGSTFEVVGISVVGGKVVVTMVDERGATAKFQAVDA